MHTHPHCELWRKPLPKKQLRIAQNNYMALITKSLRDAVIYLFFGEIG